MSPAIEIKLRTIAQRAASSVETVFESYRLAEAALQQGIPGHFAEAGVFAGANAAAMALALDNGSYYSDSRRVVLFDSFQGVPAAGPEDHTWAEAYGTQTGVSAQTRAQVESHMKEWGVPLGKLVFVEGWFADTLPDVPSNVRYAVLRIDCDLYEPTKLVMQYLYPLVSPGGYVVADDFQLDGARKAVAEGAELGPIYWRKPK